MDLASDKKRKRADIIDHINTLFTTNELSIIKSSITESSITAVRKTHLLDQKSNQGTGLLQGVMSEEFQIDIPSVISGKQILNSIGTLKKESSKMTQVILTNDELRQVFPEFPIVVKKCAFVGSYIAFGPISHLRYCYADGFVESALVKITNRKFSIIFKTRKIGQKDDTNSTEENILFYDLDGLVLLTEEIAQDYGQSYTTDIPGHRGIWF